MRKSQAGCSVMEVLILIALGAISAGFLVPALKDRFWNRDEVEEAIRAAHIHGYSNVRAAPEAEPEGCRAPWKAVHLLVDDAELVACCAKKEGCILRPR